VIKSYLTIALRTLIRQKGYTAINIIGLAIGMASCILILLYVQDELSYDRHHEKAGQIYRLANEAHIGGQQIRSAQSPTPWGPALAREFPEVLQAMRFKTPNSQWLLKYDGKEFWEKGFFFADSTVFDLFSYSFIRGNPQTALNAPFTVVINQSTAKKYFGDDDPMGKVINAEDFLMLTVTGIIEDPPVNSHFHFDLLVSFSSFGTPPGQNMYGDLYRGDFSNFGLNPVIYTYLLLQKDYPVADLEKKFPDFFEKNMGAQLAQRGIELNPFLQPVTDIHLYSNLDAEMGANGDILYVYIFSALAVIIILIACINFMNQATARSANRAQEVGMRKVVGAQRGQLIQQFLGESVILALTALFLSIGLVYLLTPLFNNLNGKTLGLDLSDWTVLFSLLGIALTVGLLAGSYPAFFLSAFRPAVVLKGTLKAGSTNTALRKILVVAQFAISIVMIVGTITVYNQLEYIRNMKLGFDKEHVINMPLANIFMSQRYQETFKDVITQHPNVLGATGASSMPGGLFNVGTIRPPGTSEEENRTVQVLVADYEYLPTMGMELAAGRNFSLDFGTDPQNAVILNETAVQAMGWDNPVGQLIALGGRGQNLRTVVGVVKDFHLKSVHQKIEPLIIFPSLQPGPLWYASIKIRGENTSDTMAFLEQSWAEIYAYFPYTFSFMDEDYDQLYANEQRLETVFGAFALFSILITCLGLFALASFMTAQRTKEIGIRKVLGASIPNILVLLSRDFTILVLVAFIIAAPAAYYLMDQWWLQSFAYRLDLGLGPFALAGIISLLIAWLTVGYHAAKIAQMNPVETLKYE